MKKIFLKWLIPISILGIVVLFACSQEQLDTQSSEQSLIGDKLGKLPGEDPGENVDFGTINDLVITADTIYITGQFTIYAESQQSEKFFTYGV